MAERRMPMSMAIIEGISQRMQKDQTVFVMGEDIGTYGGIFGATTGLLEKFGPERIRDTPISESAFIGAAIGASAMGMRPIAELMFVDFIGVAYDQIINHMANIHYMSGESVSLPLVLTTATGGGYGDAAQHSKVLYSTVAHIPGLKVVVPSTAYDAKGLMISSIKDNNPVVYMFHKGLMGLKWMPYPETTITDVPEAEYEVPIGKANVVRKGDDVSIITIGKNVHDAISAADALDAKGIKCEVIDLRSLKPLDREAIISSVKKTGRLVVVDEDFRSYGMSGEVAATALEGAMGYIDAPVKRITSPDTPVPYSRPLENFFLPNRDKIVAAVEEIAK